MSHGDAGVCCYSTKHGCFASAPQLGRMSTDVVTDDYCLRPIGVFPNDKGSTKIDIKLSGGPRLLAYRGSSYYSTSFGCLHTSSPLAMRVLIRSTSKFHSLHRARSWSGPLRRWCRNRLWLLLLLERW